MTRRTLRRWLSVYAMTALIGVPVGWALAQARPAARPDATTAGFGEPSLGLVAAVTGTGAGPVQATAVSPAKDNQVKAFTMAGQVSQLVPGRWTTLPVLLTNPNSQSIKVLTINATAKDASAGCPAAGNLAVLGYDAAAAGATVYIVPGRGSAVVPLPIQLVNAPNRNQNACKGVSFGLSYSGTAMQWGN
jgi:hypothetical protein